MKYKHLIFDWSGTLVDDLSPTLDATNAVFKIYDKPGFTREEFRKNFRLPYSEFYLEHFPATSLAELETHFRKAFHASEFHVTVLPHAREFLEWCQSHDCRCYVLTSMDSKVFEKQLDDLALRHFFHSVYSGVIDKRELIHDMITTHQMEQAHTAYMGDMTHDVETAKHGGVTSVALLTGYTHKEALALANPDHLLDDLHSLKTLWS